MKNKKVRGSDRVRVLVTSGGTKIPIDRVRSITNMSNGTFGAQIARSFADHSQVDVTFLMAKGSKKPEYNSNSHNSICFVEYETFDQYELELAALITGGVFEDMPDIVVLAAAVSDYRVENPVNGKIRGAKDMTITLVPTPKLIDTVRPALPDAVIVGFKLLVDSKEKELIDAAKKQIERSGVDIVIANDLSTIKDTKDHSMLVVSSNGSVRKFERRSHYLPGVVSGYALDAFYRGVEQ